MTEYNMMPSADTAHHEPHLCPHVQSVAPRGRSSGKQGIVSLSSLTWGAGPAGGLVSGELRNPEQSECLISRSLHSYILEYYFIDINKGGKYKGDGQVHFCDQNKPNQTAKNFLSLI